MRNKEKYLFSVLLLLIDTAGAAGALLTTLCLEWRTAFPLRYLLPGMAGICVLVTFFWMPCSRKKLLVRGGILLAVYGGTLLLFRKSFLNSLAWAMDPAVKRINERYDIRLVWGWIPGSDEAAMSAWATFGILLVLLPYILLIGYGVLREHITAVLAADAVWFMAACAMDDFPDYVWLVPCVLGLGAQIILDGYRDRARAGIRAAVFGTAALAAVMLPVYFYLLPVMDGKYEQLLESRIELHRKVNEEWLPRVQAFVLRFGPGAAVDVTGSLERGGGEVLTSRDIYRVTVSGAPRTAVYLRGFVGAEYAGDEWKALKDSDLTKYYREKGWELPEDGRELVNLTYQTFFGKSSGSVRIEELAGAGHYSLYPYGAKLPEDCRVHWDGTVDRRSGDWKLSYCVPNGRKAGQLTEEQAEEELRYRSYVYDRFCEYPAEDFPALTAFLEKAHFRRDNVYNSLTDVYVFLRQQAVYDLEAADPPAGEDFVEYFLFESGRGYCAHFASAAVLILRYLGVPARYATGYSLSSDAFTENGEGGYTGVATDLQAHAWAEVYLDGVGWLPMEMTPGAAAFTGDHSLALLQQAGQLSGAFSQEAPDPIRVGTVREPEEEPESGEETTLPEDPREENEKPKQEQKREPETGEKPAAGQDAQETEQADISAWEKIQRPQRKPFSLSPAVNAAMVWILTAGSCVLLFLGALQGIRRLCRRRFEQGSNRDKVFLLYRNIRRLLWLAGHTGKLDGEEKGIRDFRRILEKSSFGEKEPTRSEVQGAAVFCGRLAGEEYGELTFWKKPLFLCLDLYPREEADFWAPPGEA
ncbi:MAG: transglutaminase domain-containing protein [bacterium]|nr:transglutaminase domain-containing protein [bacterium]